MTDLRPFRALRYDVDRVDLGQVLVPPYDVISAADRARLWDRDPHSAIRLELTREVSEEAATDYADVRETLSRWHQDKVLQYDPRPGFYGLRTRFTAPDGSVLCREGVFGLLRLEDYASGSVSPHERTMAGPKADRLKMMEATDANLSSVFLLYEDRDERLPALLAPGFATATVAEATDAAGAHHALMRLDAPDAADAVARFFADRPLVIADGHHRYETALEFRDRCRRAQPDAGPDAPFEFLLVYCANAWAEGSLLLPIHRLVREAPAPTDAEWRERLPGWDCRSIPVPDAEAVPALLEAHLVPQVGQHAFAADDGAGSLRIFTRPVPGQELSVRAIHRDVIEGVFGIDEAAVRAGAIAYPKDALQTARDLRAGDGSVALYLNPLSPDDVFRVTAAGDVLPQKSTFFAPKLPTGLVFRTFVEDA
ncbi:MAG: DUF1015 domain-containing protein [Myxococcota bacterium]|nr:DUF1015 domain-containing protein [Myxococcota bacterium]